KVSNELFRATAGRLNIVSLDFVPDAKRADLVISLTGRPAGAGWAIESAIEGRAGQVGLFYNTLAAGWEPDAVAITAHAVCHYIFGLVDEYDLPSGCPLRSPDGPGCLMDNPLSRGVRHGWYGRFCTDQDHNRLPSNPRSCQGIVE